MRRLQGPGQLSKHRGRKVAESRKGIDPPVFTAVAGGRISEAGPRQGSLSTRVPGGGSPERRRLAERGGGWIQTVAEADRSGGSAARSARVSATPRAGLTSSEGRPEPGGRVAAAPPSLAGRGSRAGSAAEPRQARHAGPAGSRDSRQPGDVAGRRGERLGGSSRRGSSPPHRGCAGPARQSLPARGRAGSGSPPRAPAELRPAPPPRSPLPFR